MSGTILEDPRLLHRDSSYGYTTRHHLALIGEPEAVSADVQQAISTRARSGFAEMRQRVNERRDREMWWNRLRRVEQRASMMGIDVYKPQIVIREQIMLMERLTDDAA